MQNKGSKHFFFDYYASVIEMNCQISFVSEQLIFKLKGKSGRFLKAIGKEDRLKRLNFKWIEQIKEGILCGYKGLLRKRSQNSQNIFSVNE